MKFRQVIPSEAARGAAQSRELSSPAIADKNRSLHYASLRSAPVGMTEGRWLNLP